MAKLNTWLWSLAALPLAFIVRKVKRDPQFGGKPSGAYLRRLRQSPNWRMGRFRNLEKTPIQEDFSSLLGDLLGYLRAKDTFPQETLPVQWEDTTALKDGHFLTWYGHSALRLESGGKTILLDPMLGDWVAPVPFLGHRFRYQRSPKELKFTNIDLIVLSHDHYDHLDYETILKLIPITKRFLVPLGVGIHLTSWGVAPEKIREMDWWETAEIDGIQYTFTPSRHFGGRSPGLRNKSLWGGYAIQLDQETSIYFGGDSGYGHHFKAIGERLGPFKMTMLDCGQYHDRWKGVHMHPEEAVRAHEDLRGEQLLPIHWGGFTLSNHPWFDPIERILAADTKRCVLTPSVGERFEIGSTFFCQPNWWKARASEQEPRKLFTSPRA